MGEIDAPSNTVDTTELKVAAALLPSLLGEEGTMKYVDDKGRVSKTSYGPLLERIAYNVSAMIANRNKAQISNDKPMTRERIADGLMNGDERMATITMAEHSGMMKAQRALLLGAVEVTRKQLVNHGIAVSNLAEKTFNQRKDILGLATELSKTIELKEGGSSTGVSTDVDPSGPATLPKEEEWIGLVKKNLGGSALEEEDGLEQGTSKQGTADQGTPQQINAPKGTAFLDPSTQRFKETLTPLMLRSIEAHECLCSSCSPDYVDTLTEAATEQAQAEYERRIGVEAKVGIYEAAVERYRKEAEKLALQQVRERYKGEAEKVAFQKIREEVKEELRAEMVGSYREELKAEFEAEWNKDKKAVTREEVQDEHYEMLSQMRFD